jgi:hypothetical protein
MWTVTQYDEIDDITPWSYIYKTKEEAMQACCEVMQAMAELHDDEEVDIAIEWLDCSELVEGTCKGFATDFYITRVELQ